jgi:glycosyltransferase involved in cell wall biosynthesis
MLKHMSADLLLIPYEYAPLGSPIPIVVFEILGSNESISGLAGRLLRGTRRAGVQGVSKHLIFSDLAGSRKVGANLHVVDPWVHANFRALSDAGDRETVAGHGLPYSYVLAHGISLADITPILAAWTWVDGSVGDTVPLAVIVSEGVERRTWEEEVRQMGITHSVQLLAGVAFDELPALYRRAEVLLHGGVAVEPQILRWAMACGLPVTGFDEPKAAGVLGSAGYLVEAGDTRALGAACLTVIVEPEVKDRLRNAGLMRASAFHTQPGPAQVIRGILEKKGV